MSSIHYMKFGRPMEEQRDSTHRKLSSRCVADLRRVVSSQRAEVQKKIAEERSSSRQSASRCGSAGLRRPQTATLYGRSPYDPKSRAASADARDALPDAPVRMKSYAAPPEWEGQREAGGSSLATAEKDLLNAIPERMVPSELQAGERRIHKRRGVPEKLNREEQDFIYKYATYRQNKVRQQNRRVASSTFASAAYDPRADQEAVEEPIAWREGEGPVTTRRVLERYAEAFKSYTKRPPSAQEMQESLRLRWYQRPPWANPSREAQRQQLYAEGVGVGIGKPRPRTAGAAKVEQEEQIDASTADGANNNTTDESAMISPARYARRMQEEWSASRSRNQRPSSAQPRLAGR